MLPVLKREQYRNFSSLFSVLGLNSVSTTCERKRTNNNSSVTANVRQTAMLLLDLYNVNWQWYFYDMFDCDWYGFYRFLYLLLNCATVKFVHRDFYLHFQDQIIQMIPLKWWALAQKCQHIFCRFCYLPLNGTMAKVIFFELDLPCQGEIFSMQISWKRWELAQKCVILLL